MMNNKFWRIITMILYGLTFAVISSMIVIMITVYPIIIAFAGLIVCVLIAGFLIYCSVHDTNPFTGESVIEENENSEGDI
jgi:hypothetical protein